MKYLLKINNKEISAYLRDKQIECFTSSMIQHHSTTKNNDSDKDVFTSLRQKQQINVAL